MTGVESSDFSSSFLALRQRGLGPRPALACAQTKAWSTAGGKSSALPAEKGDSPGPRKKTSPGGEDPALRHVAPACLVLPFKSQALDHGKTSNWNMVSVDFLRLSTYVRCVPGSHFLTSSFCILLQSHHAETQLSRQRPGPGSYRELPLHGMHLIFWPIKGWCIKTYMLHVWNI